MIDGYVRDLWVRVYAYKGELLYADGVDSGNLMRVIRWFQGKFDTLPFEISLVYDPNSNEVFPYIEVVLYKPEIDSQPQEQANREKEILLLRELMGKYPEELNK